MENVQATQKEKAVTNAEWKAIYVSLFRSTKKSDRRSKINVKVIRSNAKISVYKKYQNH